MPCTGGDPEAPAGRQGRARAAQVPPAAAGQGDRYYFKLIKILY